MTKFATILSLTALVSLSSVAHAGGPAKADDEGEPIVIKEGSSSSAPTGSLFSLGGAGGAAVAVATVSAVLFSVSESSGSHGANVQ